MSGYAFFIDWKPTWKYDRGLWRATGAIRRAGGDDRRCRRHDTIGWIAFHKGRRARPTSPLERRIATLSTRSRVIGMSSSLLASTAASAPAASSSSRSSGARAATRRASSSSSASSRVSRARRPLARRAVSGTADASATVAAQADFDALWSWLASEGVDVSNARPPPSISPPADADGASSPRRTSAATRRSSPSRNPCG